MLGYVLIYLFLLTQSDQASEHDYSLMEDTQVCSKAIKTVRTPQEACDVMRDISAMLTPGSVYTCHPNQLPDEWDKWVLLALKSTEDLSDIRTLLETLKGSPEWTNEAYQDIDDYNVYITGREARDRLICRFSEEALCVIERSPVLKELYDLDSQLTVLLATYPELRFAGHLYLGGHLLFTHKPIPDYDTYRGLILVLNGLYNPTCVQIMLVILIIGILQKSLYGVVAPLTGLYCLATIPLLGVISYNSQANYLKSIVHLPGPHWILSVLESTTKSMVNGMLNAAFLISYKLALRRAVKITSEPEVVHSTPKLIEYLVTRFLTFLSLATALATHVPMIYWSLVWPMALLSEIALNHDKETKHFKYTKTCALSLALFWIGRPVHITLAVLQLTTLLVSLLT